MKTPDRGVSDRDRFFSAIAIAGASSMITNISRFDWIVLKPWVKTL